MGILSSPSESAMIGPGFGPAIAVEGLGKRYLDPRRRWNLGLLLFWDNLWLAKRQELNPHLLSVAAIAMTS
jgi:hypothetical protein